MSASVLAETAEFNKAPIDHAAKRARAARSRRRRRATDGDADGGGVPGHAAFRTPGMDIYFYSSVLNFAEAGITSPSGDLPVHATAVTRASSTTRLLCAFTPDTRDKDMRLPITWRVPGYPLPRAPMFIGGVLVCHGMRFSRALFTRLVPLGVVTGAIFVQKPVYTDGGDTKTGFLVRACVVNGGPTELKDARATRMRPGTRLAYIHVPDDDDDDAGDGRGGADADASGPTDGTIRLVALESAEFARERDVERAGGGGFALLLGECVLRTSRDLEYGATDMVYVDTCVSTWAR